MAHSIKHVTLQVTFQTAPQASSITFTSTSQLVERGIFDVHVRVRSAEESLLELLTLTLKFYPGKCNGFEGYMMVFFVNVLVDCAITIIEKMTDAALCVGKPSAASTFPSPSQAYSVYDDEIGYCPGQSFLAAVLLLHVSEPPPFHQQPHEQTAPTMQFNTLLPPLLLPLWVSLR